MNLRTDVFRNFLMMPRDYNDRQIRCHFFRGIDEAQTAGTRHLDIRDENIESFLPQDFERGFGVQCGLRFTVAKHQDKKLKNLGFIVDKEEPWFSAHAEAGSAAET